MANYLESRALAASLKASRLLATTRSQEARSKAHDERVVEILQMYGDGCPESADHLQLSA